MQLFLFRRLRSEAVFQGERVGLCKEGAVGRAEVEVVDLADLGPDGVQVAGFVGDFACFEIDAGLVESL